VSDFGFSVADDPAIHRVVHFGGVDSYDQTWLWDGSRWSRVVPSTSPPGRFGAATAYDPGTRLVMVFGGRLGPGQVVDDTWGWAGTTWRELDPGGDGPPPGEGALMAWDDATRQMVLVTPTAQASGGETWIWNGSHWSRQAGADLPATSIAGEMAFDPVSGTLILASPLLPPTGAGVTTWRWDGSGWRPLPSTPPAATTGLALDPVSGHLLLCSDPTAATSAQLWSWGGAAWTQVAQSEFSAELGIEVSDIDRGQLLMLGFIAPASQMSPQPLHVWAWSGRAWQQLDAGGG
jgi:hypothetical protein